MLIFICVFIHKTKQSISAVQLVVLDIVLIEIWQVLLMWCFAWHKITKIILQCAVSCEFINSETCAEQFGLNPGTQYV